MKASSLEILYTIYVNLMSLFGQRQIQYININKYNADLYESVYSVVWFTFTL